MYWESFAVGRALGIFCVDEKLLFQINFNFLNRVVGCPLNKN
jgi:hypothetical protein